MTTLYQTVNGTEVTTSGEPVGLVLDKSRAGEELVTNGTFDTDTSGWIIEGTGATFESVNGQGVLTYGSANAYANHYIPSVIGEVYNLQFDVISGGGGLSMAGDWDNIVIDSAGHYSLYMTATSTASLVRFYTLSGSLTIDNVSVRQVGSVVLGSELVTNGTFDTDSDWNTSGWWIISNGQATMPETDQFKGLNQALPNTVIGKTVEVTFDVVALTGVCKFFYVSNGTYLIDSVGTKKLTFYASTTSIGFSRQQGYNASITIDNVSVKEVLGNHAVQPTATQRPTYNANPDRLTLDLVDDGLLVDIPTGGWDGYMTVGTDLGTATYGVSLPEGNYELGGDYFFGNTINNVLFREGEMQPAHRQAIEQIFVDEGAKASYGDVTNFRDFWREKNLTEFPLIDTSSGTDFFATWYNNNLTSFPLIDTSSGINFSNAWYGNNLTSFPEIDTSNGSNFDASWFRNNLTEFPELDVSNGVLFRNAWRDNSLTSFPLLDTSSGVNFREAWRDNDLTSFPLVDVSNASDFFATWYNNNLTSFPMLDFSSATSLSYAWWGNNLTSFPLIDTSSVTNFFSAWRGNNLTSFPLLDVSSGTNFYLAWYGCSSLTSFPANMFDSCLATNFANAFSNTNLSEQSIDNILVSINSNGTSNGTFDQSGGSAPSATGESAITALRSRGWTITVTGGF